MLIHMIQTVETSRQHQTRRENDVRKRIRIGSNGTSPNIHSPKQTTNALINTLVDTQQSIFLIFSQLQLESTISLFSSLYLNSNSQDAYTINAIISTSSQKCKACH
jgi:hypothetical protein